MAINIYPNLVDLYPYRIVSTDTDGPLSIAARDNNWHWYLELNGEPLYLIGNACGTCSAIFERAGDLKTPLAPLELTQLLEQGLTTIPEVVLETVLPLLPKGDYIAGLIELRPTRATASERLQGVGCDADYFWWRLFERRDKGCSYELILPHTPESNLSERRIAHYRSQLQQGRQPTALALTMFDERYPMGRYAETALAHILLDGHHKVMAASQLGRPIMLLSFLRETSLTGRPHVINEVRNYYARVADKITAK